MILMDAEGRIAPVSMTLAAEIALATPPLVDVADDLCQQAAEQARVMAAYYRGLVDNDMPPADAFSLTLNWQTWPNEKKFWLRDVYRPERV